MTDRASEVTTLGDPRTVVGVWQLSRTITDRRLGQDSHLSGTLTLSEGEEGRLRWEERAVWPRPDGPVDVRRGLWLVLREREWRVLFEDGSLFHAWSPGSRVVHDCAPDTYVGTVTGTTEHWTVVWEVSGPQKDYRMVTELTRRVSGAAGGPSGARRRGAARPRSRS